MNYVIKMKSFVKKLIELSITPITLSFLYLVLPFIWRGGAKFIGIILVFLIWYFLFLLDHFLCVRKCYMLVVIYNLAFCVLIFPFLL